MSSDMAHPRDPEPAHRFTASAVIRPLEVKTAAGPDAAAVHVLETALIQQREFEQCPRPMWIHDNETLTFLQVNAAAVSLYGYTREEFLSMTVAQLRRPADMPELMQSINRPPGHLYYRGPRVHIKKSGEPIEVEVIAQDIMYNGRKARVLVVIDVTDRNSAVRELASMNALLEQRVAERTADLALVNEKLRYSEQRFRSLANTIPVLIWVIGADMRRSYCNQRVLDFTGRTMVEESIGDWLDHVHPADRERREAAIRAALTEGKSFIMEFRLRRYDGEYRWMYSSGTPQFEPDGTIAGCMGFSVDVTERRRSGRALRQYARRLRAISRQLVHVQEAERQRLSTELHDLVGQNLSALNITLNMIRGQMAPGAAASLISRLDDSQALLASTVEEIREVIADLRPALLDDYGLVSALRWYGERFEARTGIRVAIVAHASLARLSPAAESGLYRIAQEALTNAAKHSRANCIDIKLENSDRDMRMVITDNGVGFSVADAGRLHKRNGWGLIMMRERAAVIRARLELQSIPGEGTCITVELKAIR